MEQPESKKDLMCFIGIITYMSQVILDLATKVHSARGLLKKTSEFRWETDHQREFEQLKDYVPTFKY